VAGYWGEDLHIIGMQVEHLHPCPGAVKVVNDQVPEVVAVAVLLQSVHRSIAPKEMWRYGCTNDMRCEACALACRPTARECVVA
jgi:hypothetical protein